MESCRAQSSQVKEEVLCRLRSLHGSRKPQQDTLPILEKCISMFTEYNDNDVAEQAPGFIQGLLTSIIKPLFASRAKSSAYPGHFSDNPKKLWKESALWSVDVLEWLLGHYGELGEPLQKQAIESQFPLLVPPILALLEDEDMSYKRRGCDLLSILCNHIVNCRSGILNRTGLVKVFEDSLAPNMLILPSLTPEEQSLEILSCLYPAYRALVDASFSDAAAKPPPNTGKLILKSQKQTSIASKVLNQHNDRQAMLDRILRNGLLAGYIHASDYVQISTLLVTEMSCVVAMMGASSAKYLPRLLPLLRGILTNPMGAAYQPLLRSAVVAMRQLILQCWPRIAEVWWEECSRAIIGLWLLLSEEDEDLTRELRNDAKGVMELLFQVEGPSERRENLSSLQGDYGELEELFLTTMRSKK